MFNFQRPNHPKSFLFSTLSFATILFIIVVACNIFCNFSLLKVALKVSKETQKIPSNEVHQQIRPNPLRSVTEEIEESYMKDTDHLLPPTNVTEEIRIAWFKKKLPEFQIFKSTALTKQFARRAQKLLNGGCKVQFFMTWISPARSFRQREIFALESIFKSHPNGCLIILSQTMDSRRGNQILKPLTERGFKVHALAPDLPFLFKNTPAKAWFNEMKKGNKDPGEIPLAQNLSNLLRLAILYKYGGIYLDTDFIVTKRLSDLRNTIGAQSMDMESRNWTRLNNAVLIFDKDHPLLLKFIKEFALTFDGNKWGHNGPYLVSRVIERIGKRPRYNFTILPPMAFYPVDWTRIGGFFRKPKNLAESRWVVAKLLQLSGDTYGVHLWNKQTSRLRIEEGSIIGQLISDHCVLCEHIYSA